MSLQYPSWKESLLAKTVSVEGVASNDNIGAFPATTNKSSLSPEALLTNLTKQDSVLLAVLEDGDEKKLSIIHHIKNFGGTRTRTSNKIVALGDLDAGAKILKIEDTTLTTLQSLWAPKEADMLKCESKEDAEGCTAVDTAQYRVSLTCGSSPPTPSGPSTSNRGA
jgi:hypothetical protein